MDETRGDGTRSTATTTAREGRRRKKTYTHALNWRAGSEAKRVRAPSAYQFVIHLAERRAPFRNFIFTVKPA